MSITCSLEEVGDAGFNVRVDNIVSTNSHTSEVRVVGNIMLHCRDNTAEQLLLGLRPVGRPPLDHRHAARPHERQRLASGHLIRELYFCTALLICRRSPLFSFHAQIVFGSTCSVLRIFFHGAASNSSYGAGAHPFLLICDPEQRIF